MDIENSVKGLGGCFGLWFVFVGMLGLGTTGFVIWVVVKLLQHFDVISSAINAVV